MISLQRVKCELFRGAGRGLRGRLGDRRGGGRGGGPAGTAANLEPLGKQRRVAVAQSSQEPSAYGDWKPTSPKVHYCLCVKIEEVL